MNSIKTAVILFCMSVFAIETTLAAENGYIVQEINIPCQEPTTSVVSESCSGYISYKIPDFSKIPYGSNITAIFDIFKSILPIGVAAFKALGNPCSDAGIKYLCEASHPFRCEKEYVRVDTNELQATCGRGSEACSRLDKTTREQMFNCSLWSNLENTPGFQQRIPRTFPCEKFPALKDDPFTCDANYKVFSHNSTTLSMTGSGIVFAHKALKNANIADKECEKKTAEVICKAVLPACSNDHTRIVALLSKEKCREMVGCVNKTKNSILIIQANEMCNNLPSNRTSTKYPLNNVYQVISPTEPAKITSPSEIPTSNGPTTKSTSQAAQLNTRSNGMELSVILILSILMW